MPPKQQTAEQQAGDQFDVTAELVTVYKGRVSAADSDDANRKVAEAVQGATPTEVDGLEVHETRCRATSANPVVEAK